MVHPRRVMPGDGPQEPLPFKLRVSTLSHASIVLAPGVVAGAAGNHVPVSGHNLLLEVTAGPDESLQIEEVGFGMVTRRGLVADGIALAQPHFQPPLTADFVLPLLKATAAYEPLRAPDLEFDLDGRTITDLVATGAVPPVVGPGAKAIIVIAPITERRDLIEWTLRVDVAQGGQSYRFTWALAVTAETFRRVMDPSDEPPGGFGDMARAFEESGIPITAPDSLRQSHAAPPDHWYKGSSREAIGDESRQPLSTPMAHTSTDGFLRLPTLDSEPEPRQAGELLDLAQQHAAAGRMRDARDAFAAAAEAGSAAAAYRRGYLAQTDGEIDSAVRWYEMAAERDYLQAPNDLAAIHLQQGELDQAEYWFRRGMDLGDWTAAAGYGALLMKRGAPEAESVLRMVAGTPAARMAEFIGEDELARSDRQAATRAAATLAALLDQEERREEALPLWQQAADHGDAQAMCELGERCYENDDRTGAKQWWQRSSEAGYQYSSYRLGMLAKEDGDEPVAEAHWRDAAESLKRTLTEQQSTFATGTGRSIMLGDIADSGEVKSAYELGLSLKRRRESAEANQWLQLAEEAGHRGAQYERSSDPGWPRTSGTHDAVVDAVTRAVPQGGWLVLPDPTWAPSSASAPVPSDLIVGGWPVGEDGNPDSFEPNPHYVPADKHTATDPIHELLHLMNPTNFPLLADRFQAALHHSVLEVGCNREGALHIGPSPDDYPCAGVVTAAIHKRHHVGFHWQRIHIATLAELLPDDIDILINPGDSAQFRLSTQSLRRGTPH
jgi:TPR repeat protein